MKGLFALLAAFVALQAAVVYGAAFEGALEFDSSFLEELMGHHSSDLAGPDEVPHRRLSTVSTSSTAGYTPSYYSPPPASYYSSSYYSPPPPSSGSSFPSCSGSGCFASNGTSGSTLTAFNLSASGWTYPTNATLYYIFGTVSSSGELVALSVSKDTSVVEYFSTTGNVTAYLCVSLKSATNATCLSGKNLVTKSFNITSPSSADITARLNLIYTTTTMTSTEAVNFGWNLLSSINSGSTLNATLLATAVANVYNNINFATAQPLSVVSIISGTWQYATATSQALIFSKLSLIYNQVGSMSLSSTAAAPYLTCVASLSSNATTATAASAVSSALNNVASALINNLNIGEAAYVTSGSIVIKAAYLASSAFSSGYSLPLTRRRILLDTASLSVNFGSVAATLCAANSSCSTSGIAISVITLPSTVASSVLTSYKFVSQVVRVHITNLAVDIRGTGLLSLTIPVTSTTSNNTLVRLDDYTAYTDSYNTGATSNTTTTSTSSSAVSGTSNMIGDFAVISVTATSSAASTVFSTSAFTVVAAVISSFLLMLI